MNINNVIMMIRMVLLYHAYKMGKFTEVTVL